MIRIGLFIKTIWEDFVSLIFPEVCLTCNDVLLKNETHICTHCQLELPVTGYHKSINDNPVYNDLKIIENLTGAAAYLKYNRHGKAQVLLHQLKYKGNYEVGVKLGQMYGSHLSEVIQADIMIPVPIHKSKLKQRGYNQTMAICEGLQSSLSIPIDTESILRTKLTSTQTKKHKVDRWLAMEGIFGVSNPQAITGKRVLIVDDVITTGATLYSLCQVINQHDPKSIQIISIASGK